MLGKSGENRLRMLKELGKAELYRFDARKAATEMGHDKARGALKPDRWVPPQDANWRTLEKWVQAALNVVLGTKLKIDGVLRGDTREVLRRFQKEEGLIPHGWLDERTLIALEVRAGVKAPRMDGKEPIRRLVRGRLKVPPPKPKGQDDKERGRDRSGENAPSAGQKKREKETAERSEQTQDQALDPEQRWMHSVLQHEAENAVAAMAFDASFAVDAGAHLGRTPDEGLLAEMKTWFQRAVAAGDQAPQWVTRVAEQAQKEPELAVEFVREAWLADHAEKP